MITNRGSEVIVKGIIVGVLTLIIGVAAIAVTGFVQIVRAWSEIFRQ